MGRRVLVVDLVVVAVVGLLFVLSPLPPHLACAASIPADNGGKNTDLNAFYPKFPILHLFSNAARYVITGRPNISPQSTDTPSPAVSSTELDAAAIRRDASSGKYDVIGLNSTCSQVAAHREVATAVTEVRRQGIVVLCLNGPDPVFVDFVSGGVNVTVNLTNIAGVGGVTYSSSGVYEAAKDVVVVFPEKLVFETAEQTKTIQIQVFIKGSVVAGGGGKRAGGFRWRMAHLDWLSPTYQSIQRVFLIKEAI